MLLVVIIVAGWGPGAVVVCIGEDGHVGTKDILSSSCSGSDSTAGETAHAHEHDGESCHAFHTGDCGQCVDIPLLAECPADKTPVPKRRVGTLSGRYVTIAVSSMENGDSAHCRMTAWTLGAPGESPLHESISTTVLLI